MSWKDPRALAAAAEGRTGVEFLRAIAAGALPTAPLLELVGGRLLEVDEGRVVLEVPVGEEHYNLIGTAHGGLAATMIDTAAGCAVYSTLGVGQRWTSINLSLEFVRSMDDTTGVVRCEGRVVQAGRRLGIADAEIRDPGGKLIARGRSQCMIFGTPS